MTDWQAIRTQLKDYQAMSDRLDAILSGPAEAIGLNIGELEAWYYPKVTLPSKVGPFAELLASYDDGAIFFDGVPKVHLSVSMLVRAIKADKPDIEERAQGIRESLKTYNAALQKAIEAVWPAPQKLTYRGFSVLNPHEMPEQTVLALLKGIDKALVLFKARGMEDILYGGIKHVLVIPQGERHKGNHVVYGRYFRGKRIVELAADILNGDIIGRHMDREWLLEVFVHEFGHYVHLDYLTPSARAFFDSAWETARKIMQDLEDGARRVTPEDRVTFADKIKAARGDFQRVSRALKGVSKMKYLYFLFASDISTTETQIRLTPWGKAVTAYYQTGAVPEDMDDAEDMENAIIRRFALPGSRRGSEDDVMMPSLYENLRKHLPEIGEAAKAEIEALGLPSDYAMTNEREDFAETFTAYMARPNSLSPVAKHRFLQALRMSGWEGKPVLRNAKIAKEVVAQYAHKRRSL